MRGSVLGKLSMVVVIALSILVSTVRPIAHPLGHLFPQLRGFTRMSLLSESPDTDCTSLPTPAVADVHRVEPPLVVGLLLLVLQARRAAFRPAPLRRLKLPARSAERSSAAH